MIELITNFDYLIPYLRFHMGDNVEPYRYIESWLRTALVLSINSLSKWWEDRYILDDLFNISRNPDEGFYFEFPEPPIIQRKDERIIILMAAILVKEGSLENSSWSLGSWKDYEISYSNIEGGKAKESSLKRDWEELTSLIKPPSKKLARALKGSLPGYKHNEYERETLY